MTFNLLMSLFDETIFQNIPSLIFYYSSLFTHLFLFYVIKVTLHKLISY